MHDAECAEIDAFLDEYKTLDSYMPEWKQLYARDWQVRWGILDSLSIQRAELCLSVDAKLERPSLVALHKNKLVYRIDLVPFTDCEFNPPNANTVGLPARVFGSHTHPWPANREYVRVNGFRDLPYRKPMQPTAISLAHALAVAAEDLNLTIMADQRDVRLPPQGAML